ncbi:MAG: hypothetical protein Q7J37_02295 [Candidatus Omnitrophota bacterium]|nr:hypothetical protein [Candidatus Omnitrophota bacterium]
MIRFLRNNLLIFSVLVLSASAVFAAEEFTITTYYPSPYGVYKSLRLYPHDENVPGGVCTNEGETYFDDSDSSLYMCSGTAGAYTWVVAGVPKGFCVFSSTKTSCPVGYTRGSLFDTRTILGASASIGGTGGSATHNHPAGMTNAATGGTVYNAPGQYVAADGPVNRGHTHTFSIGNTTQYPPYVQVYICCKD